MSDIEKQIIGQSIEDYLPCPFCGKQPKIGKSWMPVEVYVECINEDCFGQPSMSESVPCLDNRNGTFYPLFEKAYSILLEKWNKRI